MNLELINPYVLKILISARERDSIVSISKRINLSYGWTHKWVSELVKEGVLREEWRGFIINKSNKKYKRILSFIKNNFSENIGFYYDVLSLFGIEYCFYKTDAVFIWTKGGYQVARYRDYYPIFIKVAKKDKKLFLWYCKKLDLKISGKNSVFYQADFTDDLVYEIKEGVPVSSLADTVRFMKENIYNFQPALEMIEELYGYKTGSRYREI